METMRGMGGDTREHIGQPGLRIDAIHLGRDDETYPFAVGRLALIGETSMLRS